MADKRWLVPLKKRFHLGKMSVYQLLLRIDPNERADCNSYAHRKSASFETQPSPESRPKHLLYVWLANPLLPK